jgi:hypothetical protein
MRSRPFLYAAMHDSLVPFEELCAFYSRLESPTRIGSARGTISASARKRSGGAWTCVMRRRG